MANKSETKAQQQVVQEPSMAQQLEWQQYRALQVECRAREEQSRLLHQPPKAPQENAAQKKNVQYLKLGRELAPELYDEYYQ